MTKEIKRGIEVVKEEGVKSLLRKTRRKYGFSPKEKKRLRNSFRQEGCAEFIKELRNHFFGEPFWRTRTTQKQLKTHQQILNLNELNICYNSTIKEDYDEEKQNILIAIESPAVIRYQGWLDPNMEFVAEISFENFYNTGNFYCPKDLYVNHDRFVELKEKEYRNKQSLVSSVISHKKNLEGHKFRHKILDSLGERFDAYGSGTETGWIDDKSIALEDYMFQIVVENYKNDLYVTEKFFDCLKTNTIPIYHGGKQSVLDLGFDPEGIIFFDTMEELEEILNERISEELYEQKRETVKENREHLIQLRNERKMEYYLNSVMPEYMPTSRSYFEGDIGNMNINLD